jgi:xanthosine utilization system XapX-like protein
MPARRSGALILPAAALVVHQARYSLAYGGRANAELAAQGHSYLHSLVPWVVFTLALGAWLFLRRAAAAARSGSAGRLSRVTAPALWCLTTVTLLAIYSVQETLEGFVSTGHPDGAAGVFGHGGLWSIPAAAVVAVVVVLLMRLGRAVLRIAERLPGRKPTVFAPFEEPRLEQLFVAVPSPLARAAAGRAPPHASR